MRALLSVHDKAGIVEFARGLQALGWDLCSTGNTQRTLEAAGVAVTAVADFTGSPEIMGGRVKTLHPRVHGGLLMRRDHPQDLVEAASQGIEPIDMVVGNLYPFVQTVTRDDPPTLAEAIEEIDIGGPAMIRAAAKNHLWVIPVIDPADYELVLAALRADGLGAVERRVLAAKAFQHVAHYDTAVAEYLRGDSDLFPAQLTVGLTRRDAHLRHGESPHQRGALYSFDSVRTRADGVGTHEQHHGIAMSYANLLDADAAFNLVCDAPGAAVVIIKHMNPCCFATGPETLDVLYERALTQGDAVEAYGGVVACNRPIDLVMAAALRGCLSPVEGVRMLFEVVVAPGFEPGALELLRGTSADLRILSAPVGVPGDPRIALRSVRGGVLIQDVDVSREAVFSVISKRGPTEREMADLEVAWALCRAVHSNAIVLVRDGALVGIGAGQLSRIESARRAVVAARENAQGAVLASDGFFPFPDSLELAAAAGVTAAVHPGGSIRDQESVRIADEYGIALCTTGMRHLLR